MCRMKGRSVFERRLMCSAPLVVLFVSAVWATAPAASAAGERAPLALASIMGVRLTAARAEDTSDDALGALSRNPAEQRAARELLRQKLGPIGHLIGTPMTETVSQPTFTEFRLRQTASGYQIYLYNTDSVNGAAEHLWIELDRDLTPLRSSGYLGPMRGVPLAFLEKTDTSITFMDQATGRNLMTKLSVTAKDEIVLEHGYIRKGRFVRLEKPWGWRSVYAVKDPRILLARIDAYRAKSAREAQREAGREAFGRSIFGAMVGGWTSADKVAGMASGAQAGAQGPEALQRQLEANAAAARRSSAASETRFRDSLARLSAQDARGSVGDMGGTLSVAAPRMTPQQQAQADELERFKMREQVRKGQRPTTIAEDARAKTDAQHRVIAAEQARRDARDRADTDQRTADAAEAQRKADTDAASLTRKQQADAAAEKARKDKLAAAEAARKKREAEEKERAENAPVAWKEGVVLCEPAKAPSRNATCHGPLQTTWGTLGEPSGRLALQQACGGNTPVRELGQAGGFLAFGCGWGTHPNKPSSDIPARYGVGYVPGRRTFYCSPKQSTVCTTS